ncbi:hypothetical protein CERSUDRAFT_153553 [Gelatoporia subvermispora B]|uniref:DNA-directed RNA polymerase III subunit RPC3 n=1 Tax=Ceriporiopsis subvermispora (strain B) TaxID=914234 RepID=M2RIF6_CERS8|nr:hypothetical protein CERSUDRAFT_153553 [Gelatoporia subvermispora B]
MADSDTARLCTQIIRSHFGPLTGAVAGVILVRGRLALPHIVRFSGLKPRTVRAAVLVLVQHNLLWHSHVDGEGEMLEVNVEECLMRLRYGRYVAQAEELFGKAGSEIVQLVLDHGKLRPPEIISQLSVYDPIKGEYLARCFGSYYIPVAAPAIYSQALHKLVDAFYLKPSTVLSHQSPRDRQIRYEKEEKAKISGFPTSKELREAKETAEARLKREEEEAEQIGMKRKAKDQPHRPSKRKAVEEDVVAEEVYFRVNCDRFNVHVRNDIIVTAAVERFNESAGLVLRAALKATEGKQKSVSDIRSDPTSVANISMQLSEEVDLSAGLALPSSKKPSNMTMLRDFLGILASADNPTPSGRAASFISFTGSKVQVEFEIIGRRLRQRVLETIARERHGDEAVRIIRLLLDAGKMDEKQASGGAIYKGVLLIAVQISKVGMMANKDVRPLLSALSADTLISLQEVPKSADRNPTRTFYLWYVDLQKAYSVLLRNLYKTLYNIVARREAEAEEPTVKAVLEKRQRSDVSQDEEHLLTRVEREVLAEWDKKREKLAVLQLRVEEAVFILRDLGTFGIDEE